MRSTPDSPSKAPAPRQPTIAILPRRARCRAKVPPKDRIFGRTRSSRHEGGALTCGSPEPAARCIRPTDENPILWRDFCMASRANAPRAAFFGPVGAFPGRAGVAVHPGCRRGRRRAARRAVGPNIKQCMLCIKPRSAMRGCAEGRKALRLMREALLYRRFTSKKWSITKPRHSDTLSGKYLPLIRYLSTLNF